MMLDDIAAYLQTKGLGTVGTDIFKGKRPSSPDACLALYQYAGEVPELISGTTYEYPGLQVWSRATNQVDALTKLDAVIDELHGLSEYSTTYARYLLVQARQSPATMGEDENGRIEYVVNFRVSMTRL